MRVRLSSGAIDLFDSATLTVTGVAGHGAEVRLLRATGLQLRVGSRTRTSASGLLRVVEHGTMARPSYATAVGSGTRLSSPGFAATKS